ncbi:MAG: PDZ domain-containing protein [Gemmatimonadota bacterium]|nr:MAG: PDZ domain-containing protein [Gemmatimonadota bacterium]
MNINRFKRFSLDRHALSWEYIIRLPLIFFLIVILPVCVFGTDQNSILGPPPGSYRILSEDGQVQFPFELYREDIRFEGEVNGKKVRMLLDNGILWDQILFFGSPYIDSLGLTYDGEVEVGGGGEGNRVNSNTASGVTIRFPGVEFTGQTAIVTPFSSGLSNFWEGAEGQVSGTFLKHFVVELNFDTMIVTLTEPTKFIYTGKGAVLPMKSLPQGAWAIPARLELSDGRTLSLDIMMDLGDGNPLFLVTDEANSIGLPDKTIQASLGFGVQGEMHGHYGRVRSLEIGGYKVDDIVASFVSRDYGGIVFHEATVGLPVLSRFNFTYDYPSQRMFIEPNHRFTDPFEHDMTGMTLKRNEEGYLAVSALHPDSPASEAGLRIDDVVTKVNGRTTEQLDYWDLRPMFRQEGKIVLLTVSRDGEEFELSVTLRRVL